MQAVRPVRGSLRHTTWTPQASTSRSPVLPFVCTLTPGAVTCVALVAGSVATCAHCPAWLQLYPPVVPGEGRQSAGEGCVVVRRYALLERWHANANTKQAPLSEKNRRTHPS